MGKRNRRPLVPGLLATPTYALIRSAVAAAGAGPLPRVLSAARRLGGSFAAARFNRKRLQRAVENLAVAFPDWPAERRERHAILAYEHLFMLGIEVAYTPRLLTADAWGGRVEFQDVAPLVRVLTSGRPVIFICGHGGNWEMAGYSLSLLGFPLHALYRPLDLAPLDRWMRESRERQGMVLLDKFGATRRLPALVEAGMPVGFVADQNAGDRGLFVPFFNRLASTYKAIGLMATRFDATVVCGLAVRMGGGLVPEAGLRREPDGLRYRMHPVDIFGPEDWSSQPDPLFYIAARYRRALENAVRIAPDQYLWMHRYWKSRPRFERLGKPVPGALLDKIRTLPWITEADLAILQEHSRRDAADCVQAAARGGQPAEPDAGPDEETL